MPPTVHRARSRPLSAAHARPLRLAYGSAPPAGPTNTGALQPARGVSFQPAQRGQLSTGLDRVFQPEAATTTTWPPGASTRATSLTKHGHAVLGHRLERAVPKGSGSAPPTENSTRPDGSAGGFARAWSIIPRRCPGPCPAPPEAVGQATALRRRPLPRSRAPPGAPRAGKPPRRAPPGAPASRAAPARPSRQRAGRRSRAPAGESAARPRERARNDTRGGLPDQADRQRSRRTGAFGRLAHVATLNQPTPERLAPAARSLAPTPVWASSAYWPATGRAPVSTSRPPGGVKANRPEPTEMQFEQTTETTRAPAPRQEEWQ
jgi:hypothetical protein